MNRCLARDGGSAEDPLRRAAAGLQAQYRRDGRRADLGGVGACPQWTAKGKEAVSRFVNLKFSPQEPRHRTGPERLHAGSKAGRLAGL